MTFDRRKVIREEIQKWFEEPVFFGYDFIPQLKECIAKGIPYIYGDHAYFNRGYERGNFRIIRGDVHQRKLKAVDKPRFEVKLHNQKRGRCILVFPPSKTMAETFSGQMWVDKVTAEIRKHTDRKVIVKLKNTPQPLTHFLEDAHAVMGYGTVASVEAAIAGIPAIYGPRCPCTGLGMDLSRIDEELPDREAWLNTLTWSQFSLDEIKSGFCREVMNGLG